MFRILLFMMLSTPVWAWNAAGHRLVAAIAWQEMQPATQRAVGYLLSSHPDYSRWLSYAGSDLAQGAFIEASTWPDDIRNDPRFFDEGEEATPLLPGFVDMNRHKRWHYLDLPLKGGANTSDGELLTQLPRLLRLLRCPTEAARVQALPWVIHLLGDVHQPLHVASQDDEGGNRFELEDPFNTRLPFSNLHRWWDDRPGPPWLRGERLQRQAAQIRREHSETPVAGGVPVWIEESRLLAREAYPSAVGSLLPVITEDFRRSAAEITRRQLFKAGKRLAAVLDAIFADHRQLAACPSLE